MTASTWWSGESLETWCHWGMSGVTTLLSSRGLTHKSNLAETCENWRGVGKNGKAKTNAQFSTLNSKRPFWAHKFSTMNWCSFFRVRQFSTLNLWPFFESSNSSYWIWFWNSVDWLDILMALVYFSPLIGHFSGTQVVTKNKPKGFFEW